VPVPGDGAVGVDRVVDGLAAAYALDALYRTAHHGEGIAPPSGNGGRAVPYDLGSDPMASQVILEANGLTVTAFNVDHAPISPAVGYRFDYKGRSVVVSGDTAVSPNVTVMSKGADVLVHEALQPKIIERFEAGARERGAHGLAKIMHDILDYHTSPEEAANIAQRGRGRLFAALSYRSVAAARSSTRRFWVMHPTDMTVRSRSVRMVLC